MNFIKKIGHFLQEGIAGVVFPNICVCCGMDVTKEDRQICTFCLLERFQDANPDNSMQSAAEILPEGVLAQHALWRFDKGGKLQDLMHKLKYERLTKIGLQLGQQLGRRTQKHPQISAIFDKYDDIVLVPVPLHQFKYLRRGFNQAFLIAKGVQQRLGIPICGLTDVIRQKYTQSQTGFDLEERNDNMRDAFAVRKLQVFEGKLAVVVDDVFTTGATSFELSGELTAAGAEGVIILTIAQA